MKDDKMEREMGTTRDSLYVLICSVPRTNEDLNSAKFQGLILDWRRQLFYLWNKLIPMSTQWSIMEGLTNDSQRPQMHQNHTFSINLLTIHLSVTIMIRKCSIDADGDWYKPLVLIAFNSWSIMERLILNVPKIASSLHVLYELVTIRLPVTGMIQNVFYWCRRGDWDQFFVTIGFPFMINHGKVDEWFSMSPNLHQVYTFCMN